MQKIGILGSTGSIGTNALDVISGFQDRFRVTFLSVNSNIRLLSEQVKRFRPEAVCVVDPEKARRFGRTTAKSLSIYDGEEGLRSMLQDVRVDTLIVAIVGSSALLPILKGLDNIKRIALANKEALVMAGDIIMKKAREKGAKVLPIDSEHSAVFQCIESRDPREVKEIYLTGSGGPLLRTPKKGFKGITPREAVNHPKWKMGKKISIDSATMMNKGLEVIEAHHLFGLEIDRIKVLIHPEAVVHSMVEFIDGSILAQMGMCDMRVPIQYALTYPSRCASKLNAKPISKLTRLNFFQPDLKRFPCLEIAYEAARRGGTFPCVLNASNEVAVEAFLKRRINFTDIPRLIEKTLRLHRGIKHPGLDEVLEFDRWAREKTKESVNALNS